MILRKCFKAKRKFMHIAYVNSSMAGKKDLLKRKEICIFAFQFAASVVGVLDLFFAFGFNCQ